MGAANAALPRGFEPLEPFVADWGALATPDERYLARQRLPMARLGAFYDAIVPLLAQIHAHLDRFAYGDTLPDAEALLRRLALGLAEVAQAVEVHGTPGLPLAPPGHSVPITLPPSPHAP